MAQIVIDTNVLVHSCNPSNAYFDQAVALIELIIESDFVICVDEGLNPVESENRSRIWFEYRNHIPHSSLAIEMLTQLLINDRICDFPVKVPKKIHEDIRKNVSDPTDIVFVKISFNSESLYLVSHDFAAFPTEVRELLCQEDIANIVYCYGVTAP